MAQFCLPSSGLVKHADPFKNSSTSTKQVVSTSTLPGGIILTRYDDGTSQSQYPNGICVKHLAMQK